MKNKTQILTALFALMAFIAVAAGGTKSASALAPKPTALPGPTARLTQPRLPAPTAKPTNPPMLTRIIKPTNSPVPAPTQQVGGPGSFTQIGRAHV